MEIGLERASLVEDAMGGERDLVPPRFARGCRCFAAMAGGAVAGYGWLSTGPEWIGEIELEIRPRAGEGYVWNCVTLPAHRRQGVFRSIVTGINDIARGEGLRRLWIGSVAIPAERAVGPAGFRPAVRIRTTRLLAWNRIALSPGPDAELAREALAVLSIDRMAYVRRNRARTH